MAGSSPAKSPATAALEGETRRAMATVALHAGRLADINASIEALVEAQVRTKVFVAVVGRFVIATTHHEREAALACLC